VALDRFNRTSEERQAAASRRRLAKERVADRRRKAWQLHLAGVAYDTIAKQLGISKTTAHRDVGIVLSDLHKNRLDSADLERARSMARIERLIQALWPAAISGDTRAAAECRALEGQRIRLLGLDAPVKAEVKATVSVGVVVVPAVAGSVDAWKAGQGDARAAVIDAPALVDVDP